MSLAVQCIGFECPSFLTGPSGEGFDQDSSRKMVANIKKQIAQIWRPESITFGRPLDELLTSLFEVFKECSFVDWDGYGASAVTEDAYEEAKKIVNLLPSSIKMPEIVAEPTGEIGFEWSSGKDRIFVISVGGKHRISYAGIFGGNRIHGSEYFGEALPSVIIEHLRRLSA
jgi:hypothetical protein